MMDSSKNNHFNNRRFKKGVFYSTAFLSFLILAGGHSTRVNAETTNNSQITEQSNTAAAQDSNASTTQKQTNENSTKTVSNTATNTANGATNTDVSTPKTTTTTKAANKEAKSDPTIKGVINDVSKKDKYYEVDYASGQQARLYLLNDKTFRYYIDPTKQYSAPKQSAPGLNAKMFVQDINDLDLTSFNASTLTKNDQGWDINTNILDILFNKELGTMKVNKAGQTVFEEAKPISVTDTGSTQYIKDANNINYYGGGTQNGKFVLKDQQVKIENVNSWQSGDVASPNPFYWSVNSNGGQAYGVIRDTFMRGLYDFDSSHNGEIATTHNENRFDAIYFFGDSAYDVIKDYQELTGMPAMMPAYGFYEAHLNAYNRDFWVEVTPTTPGAIKLSDGKYYLEYQPGHVPDGKTGIKESLNGENNNYQFSARAVIDSYLKQDMPIGWFLPNDGYGAGYGQTDTLKGNLKNLADFIQYANSKGVQVGLWTQQNLAPVDPKNPKPDDRDFAKEVEAGVVALKTDVAWVGNGYSFGLDGLQKATDMLESIKGDLLRPFIITLDGWAGTQRYAGIWDGDQTGGKWEYIRFHIPTYIGEGLSGQPYVGSDMDGIFGGSNPIINTRDYQWKAFTPIQLNMDGWGQNPKNPYVFGGKTEEINRAYLKLKTMLMPYNYTMDHEAATDAKPMVRALLLDYPNIPETYTDLTKYEYLWGDNFLIAPIYQDTAMDANGNDIRNGIYLPDSNQTWVDYFTGKEYQGGQVINNFAAPIWKLPVFVKKGAIIPKTAAHNTPNQWNKADREFEIFPGGSSSFTMYEDDGISQKYKEGQFSTTPITSQLDGQTLKVTVGKMTGSYANMVTNRTTEFDIKSDSEPTSVVAKVNGQDVTLTKASSLADFQSGSNKYFYDTSYNTDSYLGKSDLGGSEVNQKFLRVKLAANDVTNDAIELDVNGVSESANPSHTTTPSKDIAVPANVKQDTVKTTDTQIPITWDAVDKATSYNVKADGVLYTAVTKPSFTLNNLLADSSHTFQVQTVIGDKVSDWSKLQTFKTTKNPFLNAVKPYKEEVIQSGIPEGQSIWQPGTPLANMFDLDPNTQAHSNWAYHTATPMTIQVNLGKITDLDHFLYIPRNDGGINGIVSNITLRTSLDGLHWKDSGHGSWGQTSTNQQTIQFNPGTKAQFVDIVIPKGAGYGGFVSGNEMMFFQTPGSKQYMAGDISNDGNLDQNDIESLKNYAGLTAGIDSDFGGYVEKADLNENGTIDAFDINFVTCQQAPYISKFDLKTPQGSLSLTADKASYKVGDTIKLTVSGKDLANVNALSMRIPFNSKEVEVKDIAAAKATSGMINFSKARTHSNGSQDLYVIFANEGEKPRLTGNEDLATITLIAKKPLNGKDLQFRLYDPEFVNQWTTEYVPTTSAQLVLPVGDGSTTPTTPGEDTNITSSTLWNNVEDGNYHRIPAIAVANDGKIIAVDDLRYGNAADLGNHRIDLVMKSSSDNGQTWSNETNLTEAITKINPGFGFGDATIVADRDSNQVLIQSAAGNVGWQSGSTRYNPMKVMQFKSTDNGQTFTAPQDITNEIYGLNPEWTKLFASSGRIMQSRYIKNGDSHRLYTVILAGKDTQSLGDYVLYSDDFGNSWKILGNATSPAPAGDEAKVEELPNGNVVLSSRTAGGRLINIFSYTDTKAGTGSWEAQAQKLALGNGASTNGEIEVVYAKDTTDGSYHYVVLQSLPTTEGRSGVGIYYKVLNNEPTTVSDFVSNWDPANFYLVQPGSSAYSTMSEQSNQKIAFLYENNYKNMGYDAQYEGLPLQTITNGKYELAFAGIGSQDDPYIVSSPDQLAAKNGIFKDEGVYWKVDPKLTEDTDTAAEKAKLQGLVDDYSKLNKSDYTTDSWNKLDTALSAAKKVLAATTSTKDDYTSSMDSLQKAHDGLIANTTTPTTPGEGNAGNTGDTDNTTPTTPSTPNTDQNNKPSDNKGDETPLDGTVYVPVINNDKNWKVALRDANGKTTGKYISTGTNWKVLAKKTIMGVTFYRLGTQDQWIPAQFAKSFVSAGEETKVSGTVHMPVINHNPNWKVALWDANGKLTGQYLKTNSNWKVFAVKVINGVKMIRLGTQSQWVPAKYTDFNL